jgi:hypothetical protein
MSRIFNAGSLVNIPDAILWNFHHHQDLLSLFATRSYQSFYRPKALKGDFFFEQTLNP